MHMFVRITTWGRRPSCFFWPRISWPRWRNSTIIRLFLEEELIHFWTHCLVNQPNVSSLFAWRESYQPTLPVLRDGGISVYWLTDTRGGGRVSTFGPYLFSTTASWAWRTAMSCYIIGRPSALPCRGSSEIRLANLSFTSWGRYSTGTTLIAQWTRKCLYVLASSASSTDWVY